MADHNRRNAQAEPGAAAAAGSLGFVAQGIADERREANRIKTRQPILAIIGNPPYRRLEEGENRTLVSIDHVAPIQLAIRLLVPEGSRLLELDAMRAHIPDEGKMKAEGKPMETYGRVMCAVRRPSHNRRFRRNRRDACSTRRILQNEARGHPVSPARTCQNLPKPATARPLCSIQQNEPTRHYGSQAESSRPNSAIRAKVAFGRPRNMLPSDAVTRAMQARLESNTKIASIPLSTISKPVSA